MKDEGARIKDIGWKPVGGAVAMSPSLFALLPFALLLVSSPSAFRPPPSALIEALMLGIATAPNPCPLAAGIAAVAFLGRRPNRPGHVLLAGGALRPGRIAHLRSCWPPRS